MSETPNPGDERPPGARSVEGDEAQTERQAPASSADTVSEPAHGPADGD